MLRALERSMDGTLAPWREAYARTGLARFDEVDARRLRAERAAMIASNTVPMSLCNMAYALLVAACFWGTGVDGPLTAWVAAMIALNGAAALAQARRDPSRGVSGSRRASAMIVRNAAMMAALFSIAPFFLIPVAQGPSAVLLGGMSAATLVIGPYVVYAVPRAALVWLAVCAVLNAFSYGLSGGPFAVAAVIGLVIAIGVARATLTQAGRLVESFADRLALERQTKALQEKQDVIALLLKEYEEGSNEWLWECDAAGTLHRVPAQLRAMMPAGAAPSLQGLAALAREGARAPIAAEIAGLLAAGAPFHDLLVPVETREGERRWLSARGRPQHDGAGAFAGFRGIIADVTEAKVAEDRVQFLASHDALTELANRITYADHVRPWTRAGRRFASLHVDLDRFKLVNDTLGHVAGDELLVLVAERLRAAAAAAHPDALPARVGGDEFMVCIPLDEDGDGDGRKDGDVDDAPARGLAAAVVAALAEPFVLEAGCVSIGASVGYAVWPDDGELSEMPARVDLALYRAKEGGRGQFRRYEAGMDRRAQHRKKMEAALRGALGRGEMHLAFQPVIDLERGRPSGVEALLRWTHPTIGAVPPDEFVPLAEESGLIVEIGAWVLREACREAAGWSKPLSIAVNVSPRQILREDFVETVLGALGRGEMAIAFQPVFDLGDGRATGVEALMRWTHPRLGTVSPASFIPLAEESGLIVELGAWVLREACAEAARWSEPLSIAVNVSSRQMLHDGFLDTVLGALASSGLAPERLELELTESILVGDPDRARATIDRLRRIGCRVVLDDFGTGYSSLSYLRTFVFDRIKVDRSFVSSLRETRSDGRPTSSTLVEAMVGMARTLGMRTTAEGIEEDWQWEELQGLGCDQGQGYLYSRPVSAAELAEAIGMTRDAIRCDRRAPVEPPAVELSLAS